MPFDDDSEIPRGLDSFGQVLSADGFIPFRRESAFCLGLDLGQSVDPTAIAIVERMREAKVPREIGADLFEAGGEPRYEVRYLQRLPLMTSYPAIINHVANLLARPPLRGNCALVADATGVGRPIVDMFERAGLRPIAVTITAGDGEHPAPDTVRAWRVSKLRLVGGLQALFHSRALRIARSQPEAQTLANELTDFRANFSESGSLTFGARVGRHDDLVLALAIACWHLTRRGRIRLTVTPLEI